MQADELEADLNINSGAPMAIALHGNFKFDTSEKSNESEVTHDASKDSAPSPSEQGDKGFSLRDISISVPRG